MYQSFDFQKRNTFSAVCFLSSCLSFLKASWIPPLRPPLLKMKDHQWFSLLIFTPGVGQNVQLSMFCLGYCQKICISNLQFTNDTFKFNINNKTDTFNFSSTLHGQEDLACGSTQLRKTNNKTPNSSSHNNMCISNKKNNTHHQTLLCQSVESASNLREQLLIAHLRSLSCTVQKISLENCQNNKNNH